jgi:hypothetical protein
VSGLRTTDHGSKELGTGDISREVDIDSFHAKKQVDELDLSQIGRGRERSDDVVEVEQKVLTFEVEVVPQGYKRLERFYVVRVYCVQYLPPSFTTLPAS